MELDFFNDVQQKFISDLLNAGYELEGNETVTDLCMTYFNIQNRLLPVQHWTVHTSRELRAKKLPGNIKLVVQRIKKRATRGKTLNAYLSKTVRKADFNDALLNDWGIFHFHLNLRLEQNSSFISRSGELLFVFPKNMDLYFLDILPHDCIEGFANPELPQIILRNWPHLLKPYQLSGILPSEDRIDGKGINQLRSAGIGTSITDENGTTYMGPGGGYTMSGFSTRAIMQSQQFLGLVENAENWVTENECLLREQIEATNGTVPDILSFRLLLEDDRLVALELESRVAFCIHRYNR